VIKTAAVGAPDIWREIITGKSMTERVKIRIFAPTGALITVITAPGTGLSFESRFPVRSFPFPF
jgi:hypothetical protein